MGSRIDWEANKLLRLNESNVRWRPALKSVYSFYRDGLQSMGLGKTLWKIIAVKLLIIFLVFKFFFFPDVLKKEFKTEGQRADHVAAALTRIPSNSQLIPSGRNMPDRSPKEVNYARTD